MSQALALDAADGRIDGRYFGRPIVQAGATQGPYAGGFAPTYGGARTFGAVTPYTGVSSFGGFGGYGGAANSALALDAADGKIDGQYFGRPIVQAGGAVPAFGATTFGGYGGGYPVASTFGGYSGYGGAFPSTFGGYGGFSSYGAGFGGASSAALALDAADGRIDGQHFGRPIVQASPTYSAPVYTPTTSYGGFGGGYPVASSFGGYGGGFPGGFSGASLAGAAARAVF